MLNRGMRTLIATFAVAAALGANPANPALRHRGPNAAVKTEAETTAAPTSRRHRAQADDGCHEPAAAVSPAPPVAPQAGSCSQALDATR